MATGVPARPAKAVNELPVKRLKDGLSVRGQHTAHPFWFARETSHHSTSLLHKADWAASQDTLLQNVRPGPSHRKLTVSGDVGHLELWRPTMRTLGAVSQRAQHSHAPTQGGHMPLGTAHASAYIHAWYVTAAPNNQLALRSRGRPHTGAT